MKAHKINMTAHKKLMLGGFKHKESKKDDNIFHIYEGDIASFIFAIKPGIWIGFSTQSKEENTFSFCEKETLAIAIQWIEEYERAIEKEGE